MKDIKCKCGHLKSEHHKTWWKTHTFCNSCQCEDYLKFNKPDKWDKIGVVYAFFMIGLVSLLVITSSDIINSLTEEELNTQADITTGEYLGTLFIIIVLVFVIITYMMIDVHIDDYFYRKRRRTF